MDKKIVTQILIASSAALITMFLVFFIWFISSLLLGDELHSGTGLNAFGPIFLAIQSGCFICPIAFITLNLIWFFIRRKNKKNAARAEFQVH